MQLYFYYQKKALYIHLNLLILIRGKPIISHITLQFIDAFLSRFNIVVRVQCGSLLCCDAHIVYTNKKVAYHLGELRRLFASGEYVDGLVDNMDETHFFSIWTIIKVWVSKDARK